MSDDLIPLGKDDALRLIMAGGRGRATTPTASPLAQTIKDLRAQGGLRITEVHVVDAPAGATFTRGVSTGDDGSQQQPKAMVSQPAAEPRAMAMAPATVPAPQRRLMISVLRGRLTTLVALRDALTSPADRETLDELANDLLDAWGQWHGITRADLGVHG